MDSTSRWMTKSFPYAILRYLLLYALQVCCGLLSFVEVGLQRRHSRQASELLESSFGDGGQCTRQIISQDNFQTKTYPGYPNLDNYHDPG